MKTSFFNKCVEPLAALSVVAMLGGITFAVPWYQHLREHAGYPPEAKVFTLTGRQAEGVFTLVRVAGYNYWCKSFQPATINVEEGDLVVFHLESADVHHRFYVPSLDLGPLDIEPGHMVDVQWRATTPGVHKYFCTSICGECHFYMQGWIVVSPKGKKEAAPSAVVCKHEVDKPAPGDVIGRGRYLFQKEGCTTCHGEKAEGGVENFNYAKKTVPALNTLAEKMYLTSKEDDEKILELLRQGKDVEHFAETLDIPRLRLVMAQYRSVKDLVPKGSAPSKLDPAGPEPPLFMPSWENKLTPEDADAIIAYLLTLYPWEEGENEEE